MAHFHFVISQNAKWGHAGFYIDRYRMTSLLTCAWLISILWLVLGLQSKIKICVPENILLQKKMHWPCPLCECHFSAAVYCHTMDRVCSVCCALSCTMDCMSKWKKECLMFRTVRMNIGKKISRFLLSLEGVNANMALILFLAHQEEHSTCTVYCSSNHIGFLKGFFGLLQ